MDESAEWRFKYDGEVERSTKCVKELIQVRACHYYLFRYIITIVVVGLLL